MVYYGIKNKKTGELVKQFFRRNPRDNISVLSFNSMPDTLCFHIFFTRNRDAAEAVLREGIYEGEREAYKLDPSLEPVKKDLEIYRADFNL